MVTIEAIGLVCSLFSRKKPVVVLIELQNWLFWSFVLTLAGYRITAKSKPRLWRWLSVDWSAIASDFNFQANGRIRISHFGQIMSLCDRLIPINYYRVPVREDMHGSVMTSTGHWNDLRVSNSLLTLEDSALFIAQHGGGYGLYKSQFAQEYFETKAASIYFTWYRNIDFTGCLSIQINRFNRPHWPLPEWFKRQRVVKCTRIIVMLPRFKKNARLDPWDSVEFYQIVVQTVLRIKHLIADVDIDFRVKGHPAQVSDDPSEYHKILEGIRKFGSEKLKSTDLCIAFGATTTLHSLLNEPCGFLAYCGLESGVDYERVISAFGPHSSQLILNDVDKMLARLATLLSNGIDRENIEKTRCFVAGGCAYDDAFRGARILR